MKAVGLLALGLTLSAGALSPAQALFAAPSYAPGAHGFRPLGHHGLHGPRAGLGGVWLDANAVDAPSAPPEAQASVGAFAEAPPAPLCAPVAAQTPQSVSISSGPRIIAVDGRRPARRVGALPIVIYGVRPD